MNQFDEAARAWDSNPIHRERSEAIALKINKKIDFNPEMTALEFGAGTGILSFLLKDYLKDIILMDSSSEMVKVMEEKVRKEQASNLKPLNYDLEISEYTGPPVDLVFTQMVLHHINDVPAILSKFYRMLNSGGCIAIADLYSEDGSFHDPDFSGHRGFDMIEFSEILKSIGFHNIQHEPCYVIKKLTEVNQMKEFPVFLLVAKK
jgi:ubiquinone/menaquinone biosynthesis C-methylase UbiE